MAFRNAWLVSLLHRSCGATAVALACAACPAGDDASATGTSTSTGDVETTATPTMTEPGTSTSPSTSGMSTSTGPDETTIADTGSATTGTQTGGESTTTGGCVPGTEDCSCDSGSCDEGLACVDDVCVNPAGCEDRPDAEPNDDEASAIELGDHDCGTLAEMQGAVDNTDIDWWTYHGIDDGLCGENTIVIIGADEDLDVCMYFECDMGNAQVVCAAASSDAISDEGRPGCCGSGSTQYNTTSCLGAATSDSGNIYISVAGPDEPMCLPYDIAYRFLD
jgi:hypothetical protein